ncbi:MULTISPECIES: lamin tail domain-containing protein [unclassified Streptomyces]|uniref:lamin tail domain-containing protein n=1 Tax=unclassified Streptomyces TaxID=2593676 RepID=UPI002E132E0B|nr:lamin tail domain-containing protein [Streptomyces sp. NBC_01207]WTA23165.1 lamin tail domain-containing protein [Streptomyces sp. NBC_00853]
MSASLATRRFVAAFLAAGALVGAAALPASADDHRRDRDHRAAHSSIVISDVQYGTGGRDRDRSDRALNREWVEVENTGRRSVNLRGFTLTDRQGNRYRFGDFRLDGGSSVRVHTGQGRDTRHDVYQDRRHQIWDERDTATLRDNRGNVLDTDSWNGRRHHRNG